MRGPWIFSLIGAVLLAFSASAQINDRGEPEGCPTVRPLPDLDATRQFVPRPSALIPGKGWKPLIAGSRVYCEDFNTQDRNLTFIRSRTIVEHGTDNGIEFKIDYGQGQFYVARGKAQSLADATAFNALTIGPYWRGTCATASMGKLACTFDSGEGVEFVYNEGLSDLGLKFDFCDYGSQDFRPENAVLSAPGGQTVTAFKSAVCTTYDLGAPGRALIHAAEASRFMDVSVKGKNNSGDIVETKRRVAFVNAQEAYQLSLKVIGSQFKGSARP